MAHHPNHMPLEANPTSFNSLAQKLGLDTSQFCFHDVLGFDDELLAFIPRPVKAAVLLYPTPEKFDHPESVIAEDELTQTWLLDSESGLDRVSEKIVFIRQTLSNHCGTMALLHSLANTPSLPLAPGPIKTLFEQCKGRTPEESAKLLEETNIVELHRAAADLGQSTLEDPDDTESHYLAFTEYNGNLIELDGYARSGPVSHGPIAIRGEGDFLKSVVEVTRNMMDHTGSIKYSLLVIAPPNDDD